jgi:hypothetical protein
MRWHCDRIRTSSICITTANILGEALNRVWFRVGIGLRVRPARVTP